MTPGDSQTAPLPKVLPKLSLPDRIKRELKTGETIYHSTAANRVSAKFPNGKWIAEVRRQENGRVVDYPVKGYATPQQALAYVKELRPDAKGKVNASFQGEHTVTDLYEFCRKHKWKKLSESRKIEKVRRWNLHIEPYWGTWKISQVSKRSAQTWLTSAEEKIAAGSGVGLTQLEETKFDLHGMFEDAGSFDEIYEDKKNPFAGLEGKKPPERVQVTIESGFFAPLLHACQSFVANDLATEWIATSFLISLLSGLREGEVMALCRDQLDFENGAILVDRALKADAQEVAKGTTVYRGPVLRLAVGLPKRDKVRSVPMSDQLAAILKPIHARASTPGIWDFLFPNEKGQLREPTRFFTAWKTMRTRLDETAKLEERKGRGVKANPLINQIQRDKKLALPKLFADIEFRDTRNSFSSYCNEVGVQEATREQIMGHGPKGVTNRHYTMITSAAFQDAKKKLSEGWKAF